MEISARNVFKGKVKSIKYGQILAELVIELPGGLEITSLITRTSADRMKLVVGKSISTIIKASNVMVATD
ncbi:MAG TPA: TOBE domain-containing protein [Methanolinea sp.]|jgi:molybdopterin-binding protein|nr:MAG: DNA-binding transcriptional regulator ModE [Methanoregulaceae archaeon PtaB.Bin009]OPY41774.1 MAG: DNA-binding transcriptional regulator ModE [Methanoregulaceae archaeon PtaU1.Bin066]HII75470.1 TOBE domain-containing protein [Methanolinea sp.]HNQ30094.1 molybdopterin-binding protein [Methanolinea sp.]HNS83584.1 molybdopterin-binding protein [Methanolinea sp.]